MKQPSLYVFLLLFLACTARQEKKAIEPEQAVSIVFDTTEVSENGIYILSEIKNNTNKLITYLEVAYTWYDASGKYMILFK